MIKLIVGLANPGKQYAITRHNAGAWYVNLLAQRLHASLSKKTKFLGYTSHLKLINTDLHLLVPITFMNLSGKAVVKIATFYHINPNEILVAHDDLDLLPGKAKFKFGGSHHGHNGVKDIIKKFSDNPNFYRLRIGIGHPGDKNKVVNFVLCQPTVQEGQLINSVIDQAVNHTMMWLEKDLNQYINFSHTFTVL